MEQVPVEMESSDSSDNVLNPNKINEETANIVDESDCKLPFASQLVSPRTITGSANVLNKGAIDWGYHGLMAYGSNSTIFVIDTRNVQIVQSLDLHKSIVKKILWVSCVETKSDGNPSIQLISGDASGHIVHWDITTATALSVLQDSNKPILGMEWVPGLENELMLAALHSPYFLVIWDIRKQTKLWKKSFTDTLLSFNFDPFNGSRIAFLCPDCILFVDDFQIGKIPSTNGRKFYISSPRLDSTSEDSLKGRDRLKRLMKGLVVGETRPKPDEAMTITECLQLTYHKSLRHHLLLLYPRDVILIDLHINQTIGIIPIERTMSPLIQVCTTRQRDVLYCLHESGSISVKIRRRNNNNITPSPIDSVADSPNIDFGSYSSDMFVCYDHKCQSEMIRQMKGSKVLGLSVDPITEKHVGLFLSSGKVVFLELELTGNEDTPRMSLSEIVTPFMPAKSNFRLLPTSVLSNVNGQITIVKMCPPVTVKNVQHFLPILGVGTSTGFLYIYNLSDGTVYKELAIHSFPIRGLEWTGLKSVITFAYGDGAKVKNEVYMTDIWTGHSIPIRSEKTLENPISILKVSPLRKFFVIVIKEGPFEMWDLHTLTLLRTMSKKFPFVVALEWSPIHSVKSIQSKKKDTELGRDGRPFVREHLVFSDTESKLYHFNVEEDGIKDGIKIPPESGVGMVTSIAFKANQIVQGDSDGSLSMWDLKARSSKQVNTNRGAIRYLRFAPGKTNLKLIILYADGLDIANLKQNTYEKISHLKWGRENGRIVDVDWANANYPVIATEDGWIRVLDISLTKSSSTIQQYQFKDVIRCPSLLPPKLLSKIHFLLCTQYWKLVPSYEVFTVKDGISEQDLPNVNAQLKLLNLGSGFAGLNIAEKCLRVSRALGDWYGVDLWTVAIYYLEVAVAEKNSSKEQAVSMKSETVSMDLKRTNKYPHIEPLDTCYDYLADPFSYQKLQLERVSVHEWKRGDYKHTQNVVEKLVLLGEMDRAVQLLLETDIDNPNYYSDAIKACLVATIQKTGAAQSTIKLVATNLIANGKIWEGVQLLCLIGKGLDGCRYLVSYGMWESAVWLAKSVLAPAETLEVMIKYADQLVAKGDRFAAILILISQSQFEKALEMLHNQHQVLIASLLLMSCQHYEVNISRMLFTHHCWTTYYLWVIMKLQEDWPIN
ncbi:WD repeat-containing protein 11-like isoform X2 [Rhodnius prolixus]|uniref:WD repeat-containing protein 11-like isoform X2 n=1 Tax=Rhodnius prolixus TaxID=13249 RepID=UPI003D18CBD9